MWVLLGAVSSQVSGIGYLLLGILAQETAVSN